MATGDKDTSHLEPLDVSPFQFFGLCCLSLSVVLSSFLQHYLKALLGCMICMFYPLCGLGIDHLHIPELFCG